MSRAAALLAGAWIALLASPARASDLARSWRLRVAGESLPVRVPKTFAPLLPGSVYPDRARRVPPRALPVALVDSSGGLARRMRDGLLARGFLIVELPGAGPARIREVLDALARSPEADASRAVYAGSGLPPDPPDPRLRGLLLFEPVTGGAAPPAPPEGVPAAAFLLTPRRVPSGALTRLLQARLGTTVAERWFRAGKEFPPEAFRDASEWLAAAIPGR